MNPERAEARFDEDPDNPEIQLQLLKSWAYHNKVLDATDLTVYRYIAWVNSDFQKLFEGFCKRIRNTVANAVTAFWNEKVKQYPAEWQNRELITSPSVSWPPHVSVFVSQLRIPLPSRALDPNPIAKLLDQTAVAAINNDPTLRGLHGWESADHPLHPRFHWDGNTLVFNFYFVHDLDAEFLSRCLGISQAERQRNAVAD